MPEFMIVNPLDPRHIQIVQAFEAANEDDAKKRAVEIVSRIMTDVAPHLLLIRPLGNVFDIAMSL